MVRKKEDEEAQNLILYYLCETRTMVIYNGKCVKLKITTYKVGFQTLEINNIFSRRKFQ